MPDGIFARLEGLDETTRGFEILLRSLADLRPFWPLVVPLFIRWMREQFESEGEWGGEPWAPLSEAYLARKMARYPGKGILIASGDLRQAASRPKRRATPLTLDLIIDDTGYTHGYGDARSVKTRRRVRGTPIGGPKGVGIYHQFGGGSPEIGGVEGRPPRRPLIPDELPLGAQAEIGEVTERYIGDLARRLGLTV